MTKIYIVKDETEDRYFLYINALGMGELEKNLAERFINAYHHVKPQKASDDKNAVLQWEYTNP